MLGAQALRTKQKCEHKEKVRLQQKVKNQKTLAPTSSGNSKSSPKIKTISDPALPTNLSALSLSDLQTTTTKNVHHQLDNEKIAKTSAVGSIGSPKQQKSRISSVRNFFALRKANSTNSQSLTTTSSSVELVEEDQEFLGGEKSSSKSTKNGDDEIRNHPKNLSPKIRT